MKYVTIASTLSGNKGAASMLEASVQTISKKDKNAKFSVFTVYPKEDEELNNYKNVKIYSAKPLFLGAIINPLAILYKILPPLRPLLRKQKHIEAIAAADVFLDQGGITFVDGRAKFLIYNVATILPAILIGTPVIKCSQAMGPFSSQINKVVAKLILPRVTYINSRGPITTDYLKYLELDNTIESTDYAFLMEITKTESRKAEELIKKNSIFANSKQNTVAVMPSEVVRKKAEAGGQDYVKYNVQFMQFLLNKGERVILLAYSAREGRDSRHNNDLPVCREIAAQIDNPNFKFIDSELSAQVLRYLIGTANIVVTSRFHAMIASLAMGTPPLVIGWSHKYEEVMGMFRLSNLALESNVLDQAKIRNAYREIAKNRKSISTSIRDALPSIKENAYKQVLIIIDTAKSTSR